MQAGRLRHRVTIQRLSAAQDAYGGTTQAWITVWPDVPAEILDLSGRELFAAQQSQSIISVRIRIRYRSGITAAMRAVRTFGLPPGQVEIYGIEAPILDPTRARQLQLMCSRRDATGYKSDGQ